MKRDCGTGNLIPHKWLALSHSGISDREHKLSITGPDDPKIDALLGSLPKTMGSDLRVYVEDKQGYRNCILAIYWNDGWLVSTNRIQELRDTTPLQF
jgi:hypothetical protein